MEYLGPGTEGLSPRAAAGILVERLKNAGDMGDRRDALDALLKLSQEHPTEVGEAGMPIFTDVLQAGVADQAMTQTIMNIMLNLVAEQEGPGTGANVSSFLKDVQNVQNLLDLLESPDTMAALSAVQVLQALQNAAADSLEVCILECPAGLQALVEVLRDPREEVRNEVVVFLGHLTNSNLEVKKFVAFQEGFERLFDIMSSEGMLEGGSVIVKDCLLVCTNLLAGSSLTKALFCQSNCLKRFHQLIDVRAPEGEQETPVVVAEPAMEAGEGQGDKGGEQASAHAEASFMTDTRTDITCQALNLLLLLLLARDDESDAKRAERQSVVAATEQGLLSEMLAHVAFSRAEAFSYAPVACRERAMRVVGALVQEHPTNQYNVGELLIQDTGLDSFALSTLVMKGALGESEVDPSIGEAFQWVLGCLFHGNELVCTQVVSHVVAPPPPPLELEDIEAWIPPVPPGKVLLDSLAASAKVVLYGGELNGGGAGQDGNGRRGSAAVSAADVMSRGCKIMAMLLTHGGGLSKEIALRVPMSAGHDSHPTTLLHVLLRWLELATSHLPLPPQGSCDAPASHGGGSSSSPRSPSVNGDGANGGGSAEALGGRGDPTPLSSAEGEAAGQEAAADMSISLMRLLCGWLYGCPAAVRELLANPANLFVVDVAAGRCPLLEEGSPRAEASKATAARVGGGGGGGGGGRGGAMQAQRVALKGLACLTLGLLLEYVEGVGAPASGGAGGGGEWTRDLVMKIIQNRVGLTPFMASMEMAKRAFGQEEAAQRRRHRTARGRKSLDGGALVLGDSGGGGGGGGGGGEGALRLDPAFGPLLIQASEEVRRRMISIFTHGGGGGGGGDGPVATTAAGGSAETETPTAGSSDGGNGTPLTATSRGAGLAAVMEAQEGEIAGLREELALALSRLPRDGGVSTLEEALRNQVGELEAAVLDRSQEADKLRAQVVEARGEVETEMESGNVLSSELQGLSVTVGSLERQLLDSEASCDGLRRQLDAGQDRSERERELSRQLEEARARALGVEDALERFRQQSLAEGAASDAAQEASFEAEAKWQEKVEQLQADLQAEKARTEAGTADAPAEGAVSAELASKLEETLGELDLDRKALQESETRTGQLERSLADVTAELEVINREVALLREAAEAAQLSHTEELERVSALAVRREEEREEEAERAASEAESTRQQLNNAVQSLAEASSGGDEQVGALQKELLAVRERLEQEVAEWRGRAEESSRQAQRDAARIELEIEMSEKKSQAHWTLQLEAKEAAFIRLEEEMKASEEESEAAAKASSARLELLEEEKARLAAEAEQAGVLLARCAKLEEAAAIAGANAERRLHEEMERDRESALTRGAEGSALESRLQEALSELSEQRAAATGLKTRLDQVQACLSQSEEGREAAGDREAAAAAQAEALRQDARAAEDRLEQAMADLEDRDGVIATVEDARAAEEREANRLRKILEGAGKLSPLPSGANGTVAAANGTSVGDADNAGGGYRDELAGGAEYVELLSEHEDLLQLLAQQEVMRKALLHALKAVGGEATARAVVDDAKAAVADAYGVFVGFTDDDDDLNESQIAVNGGRSPGGVEEEGHSTGGGIRVAV